ncbi:hypothetical protein MMC10_002300 [Thelotrema lepadinum]|nr:hypothetical protein [Thelotrema lepadinum]
MSSYGPTPYVNPVAVALEKARKNKEVEKCLENLEDPRHESTLSNEQDLAWLAEKEARIKEFDEAAKQLKMEKEMMQRRREQEWRLEQEKEKEKKRKEEQDREKKRKEEQEKEEEEYELL